MKKLIICRHGEFDLRRRLSRDGQLQVSALASVLRPLVTESMPSVKMLTSTAPRALDSTRILAEAFGLGRNDVVRSEYLWTGDGPKSQDDMLALLQVEAMTAAVEVLLVVTHLEYCASLPAVYAHRHGLAPVPRIEIGRGQARVLDCQSGECITVGQNTL